MGDAPPHGDLYTGIKISLLERSFMWKDGCPCGLEIEEIAWLMNKMEIEYKLVKIGG